MFGPVSTGDTEQPEQGVQESFEQLCEKAGIELIVPRGIDELCCGTPWSSKGMEAGLATMHERTLAVLREATSDGELEIICDASSCTEGLLHTIETEVLRPGQRPLRVIDAVEFTATHVLPKLSTELGQNWKKLDSLTLHPTCSSTRMGLNGALETVAAAVALKVNVPDNWGCCAFAGDRGLLHPELSESATKAQAADIAALDSQAHASCNRTCELGMTRATGADYKHVLDLLAQAVEH